jgi:hypothetical protein
MRGLGESDYYTSAWYYIDAWYRSQAQSTWGGGTSWSRVYVDGPFYATGQMATKRFNLALSSAPLGSVVRTFRYTASGWVGDPSRSFPGGF